LFGSCILFSHLIIASTSVASFAAVVVYKDGRPGLPWFEGPKGLNAVKARAMGGVGRHSLPPGPTPSDDGDPTRLELDVSDSERAEGEPSPGTLGHEMPGCMFGGWPAWWAVLPSLSEEALSAKD